MWGLSERETLGIVMCIVFVAVIIDMIVRDTVGQNDD